MTLLRNCVPRPGFYILVISSLFTGNDNIFLSGFFSADVLTELFEAFALACTLAVSGSVDSSVQRFLDRLGSWMPRHSCSSWTERVYLQHSAEKVRSALGALRFWLNNSSCSLGIDMEGKQSRCRWYECNILIAIQRTFSPMLEKWF